MIRGAPVKVRALPDRAKHVRVKVKRCEVGGVRAEFDYPVGVLCASDTSKGPSINYVGRGGFN